MQMQFSASSHLSQHPEENLSFQKCRFPLKYLPRSYLTKLASKPLLYPYVSAMDYKLGISHLNCGLYFVQ